MPDVEASKKPKPVTVPQSAVAVAKAMAAALLTVAGVVSGSDPEEPVAVGNAENWILSPEPTPEPVAFADIVTVVPVTERTVVPAGITLGAVRSEMYIPGTIQLGVDEKCRVGLPLAVAPLVVAAPATCTRACAGSRGNGITSGRR